MGREYVVANRAGVSHRILCSNIVRLEGPGSVHLSLLGLNWRGGRSQESIGGCVRRYST